MHSSGVSGDVEIANDIISRQQSVRSIEILLAMMMEFPVEMNFIRNARGSSGVEMWLLVMDFTTPQNDCRISSSAQNNMKMRYC